LEALLLTYGVKSVVDAIKELNQFFSGVSLDYLVETVNINENYSDLTLSI
jgi:hypothetical protein